MTSETARILVVDDIPDTVEVLERNLSRAGYSVLTAGGVREAIGVLDAHPVDVVVTDLKMPGLNGMELLRHVRDNCKEVAVVVITGYPSVEGAVQAIKTGAEDFLAKPFTDEELLGALQKALDRVRSRRALQRDGVAAERQPGLLGDSEPMRRVSRALERAARTDTPVLIVGADGTGKELAARTIHCSSARAGAPFVRVSLATIPPDQAEREVVGAPGHPPSGGLFLAARAGTLYLDHLDHASPALLAGLRGLLDAPSDLARPRIIASVVESVARLARQDGLRTDLLERLTATTIELPALCARGDDILILAGHFAREAAARTGREPLHFTDQAIQVLRGYSWPGNVRELRGAVESLVAAGGSDDVDVADLPALMRLSAQHERLVLRPLAEVEREHIEEVMAAVGGHRSRAAEVLGIDRKTLREKMKRGAATDPDPES
jgi:two-component system, NtrC family, response regulator HydG